MQLGGEISNMKIKSFFCIFLGVIMFCATAACSKKSVSDPSTQKTETTFNIKPIPDNENVTDVITNIYNYNELLEISKFEGSLEDLNKLYPIEFVRNVNGVYRVSYLGNGNIAILFADNSEKVLMGKVYNTRKTRSEFAAVKAGQSVIDVEKFDPDGEYLFLYTGRNDLERVSTHYTKDGYLIRIEYDNACNVVNINETLI